MLDAVLSYGKLVPVRVVVDVHAGILYLAVAVVKPNLRLVGSGWGWWLWQWWVVLMMVMPYRDYGCGRDGGGDGGW